MFDAFRRDLQRAAQSAPGQTDPGRWLQAATSRGVLALGVYRFARWVHSRPGWLSGLLEPAHFLLIKAGEALTQIKIYPTSDIGAGCRLEGMGIVVLGIVGEDCVLGAGSQLISRSDGRRAGFPSLGSRVLVGPGTTVTPAPAGQRTCRRSRRSPG